MLHPCANPRSIVPCAHRRVEALQSMVPGSVVEHPPGSIPAPLHEFHCGKRKEEPDFELRRTWLDLEQRK